MTNIKIFIFNWINVRYIIRSNLFYKNNIDKTSCSGACANEPFKHPQNEVISFEVNVM